MQHPTSFCQDDQLSAAENPVGFPWKVSQTLCLGANQLPKLCTTLGAQNIQQMTVKPRLSDIEHAHLLPLSCFLLQLPLQLRHAECSRVLITEGALARGPQLAGSGIRSQVGLLLSLLLI